MAEPHSQLVTDPVCQVLNATDETFSPFSNGGLRVSMIARAIKVIIQMPTGIT